MRLWWVIAANTEHWCSDREILTYVQSRSDRYLLIESTKSAAGILLQVHCAQESPDTVGAEALEDLRRLTLYWPWAVGYRNRRPAVNQKMENPNCCLCS